MALKVNVKLVVFLLVVFLQCSSTIRYDNYLNYTVRLDQLIDSLKIKKKDLKILIDKSEYKLTLYTDDVKVKEYPVVFGGDPVEDKLREGDERTPEGVFSVRGFYPHKSWSKFIWIDYPTRESWRKHEEAKAEGRIPETAKIGGEIGIHGVPSGYDNAIDYKTNWTLGCISLKNNDVNEIYRYVYDGMPVTIVK
ncbi:L,D-transpeptidase [Fulvivirga ulvae]|uniref:L,D-transpeptidase family protein n=1 Tax=Fulvivirga ulvae TaxID=2904245 RepID=UPI001F2C88F5|nr:L,D-transpeptidase [Fulvivirga ulvae]UII31761.1 L,D-transpeptidase [Fulvivirga ulvae]